MNSTLVEYEWGLSYSFLVLSKFLWTGKVGYAQSSPASPPSQAFWQHSTMVPLLSTDTSRVSLPLHLSLSSFHYHPFKLVYFLSIYRRADYLSCLCSIVVCKYHMHMSILEVRYHKHWDILLLFHTQLPPKPSHKVSSLADMHTRLHRR
jgi:hypothetical protein